MVRLFAKVLNSGTLINMTLTGSVIILFVLIARLCLKRAPKVYTEGQFDHVTIRVNQFMDDDYEVVESILNTDSAAISEYCRTL